jgi:hypothetical protein
MKANLGGWYYSPPDKKQVGGDPFQSARVPPNYLYAVRQVDLSNLVITDIKMYTGTFFLGVAVRAVFDVKGDGKPIFVRETNVEKLLQFASKEEFLR